MNDDGDNFFDWAFVLGALLMNAAIFAAAYGLLVVIEYL